MRHTNKNKELRKQDGLRKESHFLFIISPQILFFSIEIFVQNHMLYVQACFMSYNNIFIRNLKLSLALSILSHVNMVIKCYTSVRRYQLVPKVCQKCARSVCYFKVLQQLGL